MYTIKTISDTINFSSKRRLRKAAAFAASFLVHIRAAEDAYMECFPESLQDSEAYAMPIVPLNYLMKRLMCLTPFMIKPTYSRKGGIWI